MPRSSSQSINVRSKYVSIYFTLSSYELDGASLITLRVVLLLVIPSLSIPLTLKYWIGLAVLGVGGIQV
jgi:hypothetical protein